MISIRPANKSDISFIIEGILTIETIGTTNSYNRLFGTDTAETKQYLQAIFEDEENLGTELSLPSFLIAEAAGERAGCSAHIFTGKSYYQNKSELFPIHLPADILANFIAKAQNLPNHTEVSRDKNFIEYIYTHPAHRRKGIAEQMIKTHLENIGENDAFINVFGNKPEVINYYKKLGFAEFARAAIDAGEGNIYPAAEKVILKKIRG